MSKLRRIAWNGETLTALEWGTRYGVDRKYVWTLVARNGVTEAMAYLAGRGARQPGQTGRPARVEEDASDLRFAAASLRTAHACLTAGDRPNALAQVVLVSRFMATILRRNRVKLESSGGEL